MKIYQSFATSLSTLLGPDKAVRLTVEGFMPLSIEEIGADSEGRRLIAVMHTGQQNGDLMRDPELVFAIQDWKGSPVAEPISFRNDYLGILHEVYRYDGDGKRTHVVPELKRDLRHFTHAWFENLRDQGFFGPNVKRERLA